MDTLWVLVTDTLLLFFRLWFMSADNLPSYYYMLVQTSLELLDPFFLQNFMEHFSIFRIQLKKAVADFITATAYPLAKFHHLRVANLLHLYHNNKQFDLQSQEIFQYCEKLQSTRAKIACLCLILTEFTGLFQAIHGQFDGRMQRGLFHAETRRKYPQKKRWSMGRQMHRFLPKRRKSTL